MLTASARRAMDVRGSVRTYASLAAEGWTDGAIVAQLSAGRWRRFGRAIVLHGGPVSPDDKVGVALLNSGPRAVLTAFTAVRVHGLTGWDRTGADVLVPGGTHVRRIAAAPVRVHYTGDWDGLDLVQGRRLHRCGPSLLLAAASFRNPRPGCGILAAGVQQGLVTAADLRRAADLAPRARHRRVFIAAIDDIAQGAQALSEIDFAVLCRRHGLPEPTRQAVRVEPGGRRRYLDVEWRRVDGVRVVAEIDGALHLAPRRWWDDQLRQNELAISGDLVLRFPSVIVRLEEYVVLDQLRRALLI